ncbi:hypothetical protein [Chryseobacterium luteum]|nr:hypothetical protein [Chryseobacterium luteum]
MMVFRGVYRRVYSKAESDEVDKDFKTSSGEVVKNFNYIFKADNT